MQIDILFRFWEGVQKWWHLKGFHALLICEVLVVHFVVCVETVLIVYLVSKIDEFRKTDK